jgi:hypothetical protein
VNMTKGERTELKQLLRRREKVAKSGVEDRAAVLKADFEEQLASEYSPYDDALWAKATEAAEAVVNPAVAEAERQVNERCEELGIPEWARPRVVGGLSWLRRGENAVHERRIELRRVADTKIAAYKARAKKEIERQSVEIETRLVAAGLESDIARGFLEQMPDPEELMPKLDPAELRKEIEAAPKAHATRSWEESWQQRQEIAEERERLGLPYDVRGLLEEED